MNRQDPTTGNFVSYGPGPALTVEQRTLAQGQHAAWAAERILGRINSGDRWWRVTDIFRANYETQGDFFRELIEQKVFDKSISKHPHPYYVPNGTTIPWCNTALGFFDERAKTDETR